MITKNSDNNTSFVISTSSVTKSFPIESGLHYDIAMRIFEYYKQLGIDIDYDIVANGNKKQEGYFITTFPKLELLPNDYKIDFNCMDDLMGAIIKKYPIPTIEKYKTELKHNNINIHVRDIKSENLFTYNDTIYLLDVADFYFTIDDDNGTSMDIPVDIMNELGIKHYTYPFETKNNIPQFAYIY